MAIKKNKKTSVVLCANIRKLGNVGDIVQVAPGYHRNYLEPQGKAFFATAEKIEKVRIQSEALKAEDESRKVLALKYAEELESFELTFSKESNEAGVMFGSVTTLDVCQLLVSKIKDRFPEEEFKLSKSAVLMDKSLKTFGTHEVSIELHPQVVVNVRIIVAPKMLNY
ncbi:MULTISPECIES: 50S ribosomal protein L9 [Holospora]|uniref:Large ribosomal subunit protein bL9 n=2 Tax=Holospora TaxID=44747 RepID=A0A061JFX0_9PROT|nr:MULTISPECIES: 50S ribosomal protein L9 [Holospora]ETZ04666.1 50S ribosomal protein L9 [Holospora undulata HU1]GAJ45853.1 50S ribosomal protein L9 [Holospora elegans E1]